MKLKPPKKASTPYGGKITYVLPGKNRLSIHCKDKNKIRHRKRWSQVPALFPSSPADEKDSGMQVMYLYYLLGFRVMQKVEDERRKELISENSYILTLDGDIDFKPACVHLLVDLMKKNRRLGAACGRIHPRGSGIMVWYAQLPPPLFPPSWLRVKGGPLKVPKVRVCHRALVPKGHRAHDRLRPLRPRLLQPLPVPSPFSSSLIRNVIWNICRACALMDDNVARKYAMKSENPKDYIQYDQGEDRWLCTLLLQRGYRVEYCAASDALTFAPEGFNEFFNQRRRWIPSTIANIVDLLVDYKAVIHTNESISIWSPLTPPSFQRQPRKNGLGCRYIGYQFVMLVSSVLGPGTIFLMVVGAISISFDLDTSFSFLVVSVPVIFFGVVCYTCSSSKQVSDLIIPIVSIIIITITLQLAVAQIIGALFAMLMTAVIVGTALQIKKDGIYSPHAIFLFAVIASFFIAACLHPLEFSCIIPGILYFLAIPCMYMLLPVYSVCNLHVVSWGTRETTKVTNPPLPFPAFHLMDPGLSGGRERPPPGQQSPAEGEDLLPLRRRQCGPRRGSIADPPLVCSVDGLV